MVRFLVRDYQDRVAFMASTEREAFPDRLLYCAPLLAVVEQHHANIQNAVMATTAREFVPAFKGGRSGTPRDWVPYPQPNAMNEAWSQCICAGLDCRTSATACWLRTCAEIHAPAPAEREVPRGTGAWYEGLMRLRSGAELRDRGDSDTDATADEDEDENLDRFQGEA